MNDRTIASGDETNRLSVQRAMRLLADTDWTAGRLADKCGFGDTKLMVWISGFNSE
jgi:AraC-like DNA-binding protein